MTDRDPVALNRRRVIGGAVAAGITLGVGRATAQSSESPMRMVIGFPPGGSGDLFGRIVAEPLREELSRTVIVENKPGAGGITAAVGFLRAPKDGSQVLLVSKSMAVMAPISRASPPYNPLSDFQWIALLVTAPFVIAVSPALPVTDLKSLIAYAKARPGKMSYGHAGLGTSVHLAAELMKDIAGIDVVHVPYPGSAGAINDTIAGNVQFVVETTGTLLQFHKAGKLRIVAALAEGREKLLPEISTAREAGYDVVADTSFLLALPLGTPREVTDRIAKAVDRVMKRPFIQERMQQIGFLAITDSGPAQAQAYVASEVARWSPIVKKLGIAL